MRYDWAENILSELTDEITVGYVGSMTHEYVDSGIPFLRSKNISNYEVIWDDIKYVSSEFHKKIKKSVLRSGDVAVVRTGKPGTSCVIPDELPEANCSDLVIVRVNTHKLCPYFLCYYLNSIAVHQINSQLVGAVQQHFNVASAKNLKIKLPSLVIQKKISHFFQCIDNKIKLNKKINQTLEQMAQALFKSWFVDFEPVEAKMAVLEAGGSQEDATLAAMTAISGKDADALVVFEREHPEQYAELKVTAELFPSAMQESEFGDVPKGWYLDSIYEVANVIYGAPFKSKEFHNIKNEGLPLVRIRDLKDESPGVRTNEIHPKGYLLNDGDLIIGMDGEFKPYIWGGGSAWMNQRVCLFNPKKEIDEFFILNAISSQLRHLELTATATTVIHLGKGDIDKFTFMRSSDTLINKYSIFSRNFKQLLLKNKQENRILTQLRDTLLPKLLSGEITPLEAEQAVSEVENV